MAARFEPPRLGTKLHSTEWIGIDDANRSRPTRCYCRTSLLIEEIADWLMAEALSETTIAALFEGCCNRLFAAGVPLLRAHITYHTLHPLYNGTAMTWWRDRALEIDHFPRSDEPPPERWLQSPYFFMIDRCVPMLRRRLSGAQAQVDFPMLEDLRAQGATGYLADLVAFDNTGKDGIIGSWISDREGGFADTEVTALLAEKWQSLGSHDLRGVSEPFDIFTPAAHD